MKTFRTCLVASSASTTRSSRWTALELRLRDPRAGPRQVAYVPCFLRQVQTGDLQPPKYMVWGSLVVCHAETKHTVEIDLNALARGLCEAEPWDLQPGLVQLVWFQYRDLSKGIQVSPTKKSKLFSLGVCVQDGEGRSVNFQMKIRNRSLQAMHAANVDVARQAFDYALRLIQRMAAIKSCPPGVLTVDLGDVEKVATCITSFDTGFSACENRGIDRQKLRREVEAQPIWHFGQKTVQLHIKDTKCWGVPLLINMSSTSSSPLSH